MIKTFLHKGLKAFYETGTKAGIQPHHASRLRRQLLQLNISKKASDMNIAGWNFHVLIGEFAEHYSISVNGNWRMTFKFEDGDAVLVNYQDYH